MELAARKTKTAHVQPSEGGWRLSIPAGPANAYRLAQVDDYSPLRRSHFPWQAPLTISLEACVSASALPGTWGFGLWNDPFGVSLGEGGSALRLPCLPNAAWFFHASAENHLSFQDDRPAHGFLAQTFSSPRLPAIALLPTLLGAPFLRIRPFSRTMRRLARKIIQEDSTSLSVDVTQWHSYSLEWRPTRVAFTVDGDCVLETPIVPRPPLGIVIWIDNQYAAWRPDGVFRFGVLANSEAWLKVKNLRCH